MAKELELNKVVISEHQAVTLEKTYLTKKKDKEGNNVPYTFRMRAFKRDDHYTLLNKDDKPIFDFRNIEKDNLLAFLECLVALSQLK